MADIHPTAIVAPSARLADSGSIGPYCIIGGDVALAAGVHLAAHVVIDGRKGADHDTSYTARLFSRGRQQIAKKLGEEAVEALIEGIRGDKPKLVGESADMLYHLLTLWAATGVKPPAVWAELARREGLSGLAEKAARKHK